MLFLLIFDLRAICFGFCREAFAEFDPTVVAKMEEKEIIELSSNKKLMLAESRVRCIVDNAKCIVKVSIKFYSPNLCSINIRLGGEYWVLPPQLGM